MTPKAHKFVEANKISPVEYGSVLQHPTRKLPNGAPEPRGVYYRLADGKTFTLYNQDLEGMPAADWGFEVAA